MEAVLYLFIFIFGAIIGSFLNVVIARWNTSFTLFGRSICFSCRKILSWRELSPLLSFLLQKGKCFSCKSKISWQYPAVEALTGFVFTLVFWKFGGGELSLLNDTAIRLAFGEIFFVWIVMSILVVILAYDLKHKIIPDSLAYGFALLAFGKLAFDYAFFPGLIPPNWLDFLAGPLLASPLAALWLFSKGKWIGLGDAKLTLGLGWFLGLAGGLDALLLAFWIGAVVGIFLIILSRIGGEYGWNLKSEMPFAPFIILGLFLAFMGISPLGAIL
ncbi:prepilin peptidase [bacterium]|nr:prepilin peptidase [bacterium]